MVNKKLCLGMILMVLVFGMTVAGCSDDTQIVAFEYAEAPSEVRVFGTIDENGDVGNVITVYWNSVKNALSYDVYGQMEPINSDYGNIKLVPDIKHFSTIQAYGIGGVPVLMPGQTPGVLTTRIDEMRAIIDISEVQLVGRQGLKWRFGVTVTDIDKNKVPSKIVWSEYVTIP